MIDHIGVQVGDYARSRAFYERALAPLGYEVVMAFEKVAGFGVRGKPDFWIIEDETGVPIHVAFASPDRPTVDAFHEAAIAAGGRDNGPPGIRADYYENYYGAYVLDPDGHNVEAVCHAPG